ncbi:hypothetical protein K469DRAFT_475876, partial [Zopfia rhizophila CBS 207.26]
MHGESTWAGSLEEQAGSFVFRFLGNSCTVTGALVCWQASREDEVTNKELSILRACQTRSDCHSAMVPKSRARAVHGRLGAMLKRLAVTK